MAWCASAPQHRKETNMANKTNTPVFGRVVTAVVTPFNKRGQVDYDACGRLLKHLQTRCDAIVVAGTTGEGPTLSDREKLGMVEYYKTNAKRGFQVLANIGSNDTA